MFETQFVSATPMHFPSSKRYRGKKEFSSNFVVLNVLAHTALQICVVHRCQLAKSFQMSISKENRKKHLSLKISNTNFIPFYCHLSASVSREGVKYVGEKNKKKQWHTVNHNKINQSTWQNYLKWIVLRKQHVQMQITSNAWMKGMPI